jgi:hypothetical protein
MPKIRKGFKPDKKHHELQDDRHYLLLDLCTNDNNIEILQHGEFLSGKEIKSKVYSKIRTAQSLAWGGFTNTLAVCKETRKLVRITSAFTSSQRNQDGILVVDEAWIYERALGKEVANGSVVYCMWKLLQLIQPDKLIPLMDDMIFNEDSRAIIKALVKGDL